MVGTHQRLALSDVWQRHLVSLRIKYRVSRETGEATLGDWRAIVSHKLTLQVLREARILSSWDGKGWRSRVVPKLQADYCENSATHSPSSILPPPILIREDKLKVLKCWSMQSQAWGQSADTLTILQPWLGAGCQSRETGWRASERVSPGSRT